MTHRGLYRYKRLMIGVTSASERYQQIIRDMLRGCGGVANIADDLINHGSGVEEHDRRLFAVLDRLREVGLTPNGNKCEFRLSKLTFFGHELTSDGVNPSEEKIAAIRDARPPKDASEVRLFMGLVQYSAKFLPDVASVFRPIHTRANEKGYQVCLGCGTANCFRKAKVDDYASRHTVVLQGRLQDANCCGCVTGWSRRGTHTASRICLDGYRVRL